jgi:hypothetical protein
MLHWDKPSGFYGLAPMHYIPSAVKEVSLGYVPNFTQWTSHRNALFEVVKEPR